MLKVTKIVGLNSDQAAAQAIITLSPKEGPPVEFSFFALAYCTADDAFTRVRQALSDAETTFNSSNQPLAQKLEEIMLGVKKSLEGTEEQRILLSITQKDETLPTRSLYLMYEGVDMVAYLLRGEQRVNLYEMASEGQLISGFLREGDRVLLATKSFEEILGEELDILHQIPVDSLEDELMSRVSEAQVNPVAAIFIEEEVVFKEEATEEVRTAEVEKEMTLSGIKLRIPSLPLALFIPFGKKILTSAVPRSKKAVVLIGVVLTLIVLGGYFGNQKVVKDKEKENAFTLFIQRSANEYGLAQSQKDLNTAEALQGLERAKEAVNEALKIKSSDQMALDLKNQIDASFPEFSKTFSASELPLWLDLNLIKKDLIAQRLSLFKENLLVLGEKEKVLIKINLGSKANQIISGGEKLGDAQMAALNGNNVWVFSADKGLLKLDTTNNQISLVAKVDKEWGKVIDVQGFASNAYVLDSSKNQIWKYVPIESGYAEKKSYFKEGVVVDFSGVKKMQIDSSIWILKENGEIKKFTYGSPESFAITGLDKPINTPKSFFVSEDTENVYILDSGNNRLVVSDKKGGYKAQYASEKISNITDIVVDEKAKKAYLLEGSKIYLMELK